MSIGTEQENEAHQSDDKANKSGQQHNDWWFKHPGTIERFTGWLVVWTALLFVGTMASAIILWRTDSTLRETLDASNRAWISVVDAELQNTPAEGLPLLGNLNYQNIGKSPALNANYVMFLQELPTDKSGGRATPTDDACRAVKAGTLAIFPSEKHAAMFPYGKEGAPSSAVMKGEAVLYWRGCFQYETFERRRHTQFCFYLRHSGPTWHWQDCGTEAD